MAPTVGAAVGAKMKQGMIAAAVAVVSIAAGHGATAQGISQNVSIGAFVPKFCTVDGMIKAIDIPIRIPVSSAGTVNTSVQSFIAPSVICNAPAEIVVTSMLGGAKSTAGGSTRGIDYVVTESFGGATSTIDTATIATATAAERGNTASTATATKGNLLITVAPVQPAEPVGLSNAFTDNLRVKLQPR